MVSLWPLLVSLPLALATENLFLPLTAAGTWLLLRAESHHSKWLILGAGISLGLAALTRSVIVGFPGLVALWYLTRGQRRRALYLLLPMALLITPWVVRNSLLHGQLTLIESSLGYNLYLGYHPDGTGTFEFGPSLELLTIVDDSERDVTGRLGAWTFIKSDPARVPGLVLWKLGHLWGLEDRAFSYLYSNDLLGRWPPLMVASALILTSLPLIITLPLAILGWALLERSRHWQLLTLLFAWYIGVHLLIMAEERFHFALVPMLAALAAQLMSQRGDLLSQLRRGNSSTRRRLLLGALLVVLALGNWGLELGRNADQYRTLIEPGGWRSGLNY
jgi:4-amino-4-deoxy-L-arabinose transferase-like glycosyltransferase